MGAWGMCPVVLDIFRLLIVIDNHNQPILLKLDALQLGDDDA